MPIRPRLTSWRPAGRAPFVGRLARRAPVAIALLLALLAAAPARAQETPPDRLARWKSFDFAGAKLTTADLAGLDEYDLALVRGIVFGRHGRVFKERDIQAFLAAEPWYRADPGFSNDRLSARERDNLDVIREAEARAHATVQPGDLRWWRDRKLTAENLGDHTAAELVIMAAEIEAIHGRRFPEVPWLQEYFEERYWYRAGDYDPKVLGPVELANLETLRARKRAQRNLAISPGDLGYLGDRPLDEAMLHGLSLYELRLLRNEIYARKGRWFRTTWLQVYFGEESWYVPHDGESGDPFTVELSELEQRNLATITDYENKLHEELASKPLDPTSLENLFVEDARKLRNEIYARHGRSFKDPWLAAYFTSLPWYQPDPAYDDSRLSALELANVKTLLAYEKVAESEADAVEG